MDSCATSTGFSALAADDPSGSHGAPSAMVGRWVALRPHTPADFDRYYEWRTDLTEYGMWKPRVPVTREGYLAELERITASSLLLTVTNRGDGAPIGMVQTYDLSLEDGWVFFLAYVTPQYQGRGHGAEASLLIADYLFSYFPIRKLYADVFEYNQRSLKALLNAGFVEEGRRRAHRYFHNQYWSLIHLALYREDWDSLRSRRLTHFLPRPGDASSADPSRG